METKITVLMPVYNAELYLKEAIESILSQSFTEFEFLIIDDGSSDSSVSIIQSYNDSRIRFLQNEHNLGLIKTLNNAFKLITTPYIARMDSDDISHKDRLKLQINFLELHPNIDMCSSSYELFGNDTHVIRLPISHDEISLELLFSSAKALLHGSLFLRTSILNEKKFYFDEQFQYAEDFELFSRISTQVQMANLDEILYFYRVNNHSVCFKYRGIQLNNSIKIRKKGLMRFGIGVKETSLMAFHKHCEGYWPLTWDELTAFETLIIQLIDRNKNKNIYKQELFEKELSKRLFWACFYSTIHGLNCYQLWKNNQLIDCFKVSNKHKVELFIRALLRIKK